MKRKSGLPAGTRRKRGGQPGNQNARKHGLYCGPMTPDETCLLWNLLNATDIEPETAVLRIKLLSALQREPDNHRLIRDAARLVARWRGGKLGLNKKDTNALRKTIQRLMEAGPAGLSEDAAAEIIGHKLDINSSQNPVLTKPIERTLKI